MAMVARRGHFEAPADDEGSPSISHGDGKHLPGPQLTQTGEELEEIIRALAEEPEIAAERIRYPSFGMVAKPAEESLRGYKQALSRQTDTQFSSKTYDAFDGIIVTMCGTDAGGRPTHAAFDHEHEYYYDYAPLRRNLAILRNYLLARYAPTGADGQINAAALRAIATELGWMLAGEDGPQAAPVESWWQKILRRLLGSRKSKSPAPTSRFLAMANIPDRGIAFMYEFLRKFLESPEAANAPSGAQPPKDWKLLPLEQTVFSDENMVHYSRSSQMSQIADAFEIVAKHLRSVDDLQQQEKEISVQHAKDILENMRIILAQEGQKRMDVEDPVEREARVMLQAAVAYRSALANIAGRDSHALGDPGLQEASEAIDKLSYRIKLEEKEMQREEAKPEAVKASEQRIKQTPSRAKTKESVSSLLKKLDAGFNRVGELDRSLPRRLRAAGINPRDLTRQSAALSNVRDGMSNTMTGPKITQVSDANFVDVARKMNEAEPEQQKKENVSGQIAKG